MAAVYRVSDTSTGRKLALKQLSFGPDDPARRALETLFEREFHTLAQLAHPHVIAVYDYAFEASLPYYTMELLDGGDLGRRAHRRCLDRLARNARGRCAESTPLAHRQCRARRKSEPA
jgi:serine/threonine protein kinase